jgi:beta-glucosidase
VNGIARLSRPVIALMLVGVVGCSTETITEREIIREVPVEPPVVPPPPPPCTVHVYTEQPVIVARTDATFAAGNATLNAVVPGNTFAIAGITFTGVAEDPTPTQFVVGDDDTLTAANLAAAVNAHAIVSARVSAVAGGSAIAFTAVNPGISGNFIAMSGTSARFVLSAFAGGSGTGKGIITVDGKQFKDLNGNGTLEPYEDWRLSAICRANDLVTRMTVPQKVGLMSEGSTIGTGSADGSIATSVYNQLANNNVRQALIRFGSFSGQQLARYMNTIQEVAEDLPLGIPFVVTADPVHGIRQSTNATSGNQSLSVSGVISPWPTPLGLGAINDRNVTWQYGDAVRREFMGMGFRWQLGPMADLASEPRWERNQNTFGENAIQVAKHVKACVEGFQGSSDGDLRNGIAATVKHFPGAGSNDGGMDSHTSPGRYAVHPGGYFEYHLAPFQAAFDVGAAAIMACYSIYKDQYAWDPFQVPSGFSHGLMTKLGKERMGFTGMITGDWGTAGSRGWNLEALSAADRAALWLKAGSHQYGSDSPAGFQAAYDQGIIALSDIDEAAAKILEMSVKLGIFENPYTDVDAAPGIVRSPENRLDGFNAQKRAIVMLRNNGSRLPLSGSRAQCDTNGDGTVSIYYDGIVDALHGSDIYDDVFEGGYDYRSEGEGTVRPVVHEPDVTRADIAVLRITSRKGTYMGLDAGVPLSFDAPFPGSQNDSNRNAAVKDRNKVIDLFRVRDGYTKADGEVVPPANPTLRIVLVMNFDRPGIVKPWVNGLKTLDEILGQPGSYPMVSDQANVNQTIVTTSTPSAKAGVDALLVDFGAYDRALLDVLFNRNVPPGVVGHARARLPMEIPSSDEAVNAQLEDVPADSVSPTYAIGAGSNL